MSLEQEQPMTRAISGLKDKMRRLDITVDDNGTCDSKEVQQHWKDALKSLKIVRKDDSANQENHLLDLLNEYEAEPEVEGNKEKAKRVLSAIMSNKMQQVFQQINLQTKKLQTGSVSKIWVPVSVKKPTVAARFCDENGHVSRENLIEMAKSSCNSVNYETIVESNAMENNLLRFN